MNKSDSSIIPKTVLDGKYQVGPVIGSGGMGRVYEATHIEIGRKVAIKHLHAQYSNDSQVIKRFQQEAQLAGSIGHDNICEVTDIGTTEDGSPYLVMPLLKGHPLSDLLSNDEPLQISRLVDIICQTLSALQAAHHENIVHRDLKPDNIFISKFGDREDFVKLLDFGISKILDQDSVSNLTQTGTVVGTPHYMSPEQAQGKKDLDQRVDIYAIGVILYEGLTGQRPFEGDSYNELLFKIVAGPLDTPTIINPSVPPNVEKVVLKAMSRDRGHRFESAVEMRRALQQAVGYAKPSITPPSVIIGNAATAVSYSVPPAGQSLPPAAQGGVSYQPATDMENQRMSGMPLTSAPPAPASYTLLVVALVVLAVAVVAIAGFVIFSGNRSVPKAVVPVAPPAAVPLESKRALPPQQGERLAPADVRMDGEKADAPGKITGSAPSTAAPAPKTGAKERKKKSSSKERKSKRTEAGKSPKKIPGRFETEIDTEW
jgi:serine/threonine-protein kinase